MTHKILILYMKTMWKMRTIFILTFFGTNGLKSQDFKEIWENMGEPLRKP